jgi:signal transduction histidine kinase
MAVRATGEGRRTWSDALLVRPWLLVAAVALFVALPVLVLGQASENDTRARLQAAQGDSATHASNAIARTLTERESLLRATLASLALKPKPETSPIGVAVQQGDVATLQALVDTVQALYPRTVRFIYIAVRGQADTIDNATILAASANRSDLIGQREPKPLLGLGCQLGCNETTFETGSVSKAYAGSIDAPSRITVDATTLGPGVGVQARSSAGLARVLAEVDLARTFADAAAPTLGPQDDAYLVDERLQLVGRANGPTPFPLRDLSDDPFVRSLGAEPIVRDNVIDPIGGGRRLVASSRVSSSDWQILVLRDTTTVEREIDGVLGQLAAGRYVLVALLLTGAVLVGKAASGQIRQRHALTVANERIEAASLHKSAFLSSMSHELRTPLNSINGFSDVLLTGIGGVLTEKQREYVTDIRGSGEHLLGLVNDVLDLSRVEAGKMDLHPTEFDLRDAIEGVHRVVAPLAQQKRQVLELEVGDLGTVRLDQARLRQVLLNVLSNAVKYTPDGGSIATAAHRRDRAIDITVRDSGIGIAAQDQAAVFDDFKRIDSSYVRTQQGTGLGLSLARRLVRLMGGDITLDSEPGRGSTFTITIPAA